MGLLTGWMDGGERKPPQNPSFVSMVGGRDPWDLDFPLVKLSQHDFFTLRQALESIAIFGELGAAKTTGSAALFLMKYMEIGMGGLVCCVKPGERELIESYAKITGRSDSLIIVSPKHKNFCNILRYLDKKRGGIESMVSTLMTIVEAAERSERGMQQGDKFWTRSLRELLRNAMEVCIAARGEVTMTMIDKIIASAPTSPEQVQDEKWQAASECYQLIEEADAKERGRRQQADFELAARYFLRRLPEMPSDTRGSILATYGVMADVLLRGHMADLFDGDTTFVPEMSFEGGILLLDMPVKSLGVSGLLMQAACTYIWQLACEQRDVKKNPRPVFWYVDEAHELVSNYTPDFLATARSSRVATILISQNKPNYLAAMGGEAGRHRVDAFLGNMGTKIFHSNGDSETNRWASDIISEASEIRINYHGSMEGQGHHNSGGSEQIGRKVLPSVFTQLQKGGEQNGFITQAIVYQTGARFRANNGEPWMLAHFKQQIPGVTIGGE